MLGVTDVRSVIWGESLHAGSRVVKVSVSGCNLWSGLAHQRDEPGNAACALYCNADFVRGKVYSADALLDACAAAWPLDPSPLREKRRVYFTGGEPALSLTAGMVERLRSAGWFVIIETNGTIPNPALNLADAVCFSPKLDAEGEMVTHGEYLTHANVAEVKLCISGRMGDPRWNPVAVAGIEAEFPGAALYVQPVDPTLSKDIGATYMRNTVESDAAVLGEVAWGRALRTARQIVGEGRGRWRLSFPHPLMSRIA